MSNEGTSNPTSKHHQSQDFVLSDSIPVEVKPGTEVVQDFDLEPNPRKELGTISGIVRDQNGNGISNAIVKVFDAEHRPLTHTFTNREGQFLVSMSPGNYYLKAVR